MNDSLIGPIKINENVFIDTVFKSVDKFVLKVHLSLVFPRMSFIMIAIPPSIPTITISKGTAYIKYRMTITPTIILPRLGLDIVVL
jgi:hypothetical protein